MTFDEWMERVDDVCELQFGLSIHALPDMCFQDAFGAGMAPEDFMAEYLPDMDALGDVMFG